MSKSSARRKAAKGPFELKRQQKIYENNRFIGFRETLTDVQKHDMGLCVVHNNDCAQFNRDMKAALKKVNAEYAGKTNEEIALMVDVETDPATIDQAPGELL